MCMHWIPAWILKGNPLQISSVLSVPPSPLLYCALWIRAALVFPLSAPSCQCRESTEPHCSFHWNWPQPGHSLTTVGWGNCRAHLICFSSLGAASPHCSICTFLKAVSYILSVSTCRLFQVQESMSTLFSPDHNQRSSFILALTALFQGPLVFPSSLTTTVTPVSSHGTFPYKN